MDNHCIVPFQGCATPGLHPMEIEPELVILNKGLIASLSTKLSLTYSDIAVPFFIVFSLYHPSTNGAELTKTSPSSCLRFSLLY